MRALPLSVRVALAGSVALLVAYVVLCAGVTPLEIGRSDFTSAYVGGLLLRQGHPGLLYDVAAQSRLHGQLIAPDTEGNLPFVDAPIAAALVAPLTLLSLDVAYRLWELVQLGLLVAAVVIAIRSAPWPERTPQLWTVATGVCAMAGGCVLVAALQAQWGPVLALGLALAYRDWRQGRDLRAGMWITVAAAIAKPHLALGLFAFLIGWGNRRALIGALLGGLAAGVASVAIAGLGGIAGFLQLAILSNTHWQLSTFSGFVGIPASFLGNSGASQIIGALGDAAALAMAVAMGLQVRRQRANLDIALAGAAALSILASPHAGCHDLVLLVPAMAWSTALTLRQASASSWWRGPAAPIGLWLLLSAATFAGLVDGGSSPPYQLVPWVLMGMALAAWVATRGRRSRSLTTTHGPARDRVPVSAGAG